jgi:hypothetical protein
MKFPLAMLLALAVLTPLPALAAPASPALVAELRAKDQALLDAIAPGDKAVWERALSADAIYVDETGAITRRAEFLKQLNPLPDGSTGQLKIVDYQVELDGEVALVIHRDDERETYHGQHLKAGYLMTETWLRRADGWKLAMVHAYVINNDPPAQAAAAAALDVYVGRYGASADLIYVIKRDGDHLIGGVEGKASHPVLVESGDVLFVPGQPRSRKIFQRDGAGHVTGFLDRREGGDLVWARLP